VFKKEQEDVEKENKAHADQVNYLKALNQDYKRELEELLSTGKSE
jgi:hypothetical protein